MSQQLFNEIVQKLKVHSNTKKVIFPLSKNHSGLVFPQSQNEVNLPYVNEYLGWRRLKSKTAVSNSPIGSESHWDLNVLGNIQSLHCEIVLKEGNVGNSRFNIYNIFDRLEVEGESGENILTVYPDVLFYNKMLFRPREEHSRTKILEGLNDDFSEETITIAQNASRTFYLHLDMFDYSSPNLRSLNKPLLLKFYFKNPADFCVSGSSTSITITSMDLILNQILQPPIIMNENINYRWLNLIRHNEVMALQASSEYTVKLNGLSGMSAYIFFMVRPSPVPTNAVNFKTLQAIDAFELNDKDNQILAIKQTPLLNRYIVSKVFPGEILNYNYNIYVIPFCINASSAVHGSFTGGQFLSSHENLKIFTPSTLTPGNFEISVWSANYEYFTVSKGRITSSK